MISDLYPTNPFALIQELVNRMASDIRVAHQREAELQEQLQRSIAEREALEARARSFTAFLAAAQELGL